MVIVPNFIFGPFNGSEQGNSKEHGNRKIKLKGGNVKSGFDSG
jgi:hypothetical protein